MKILFVTAGIVPAHGVSNSYQEALMEGLAARGHAVACLCTAGVKLRPGVSWACDQEEPYKRYTVFNGGVYPALYPQGGVGSRRPLRDIHSRSALRRAILKLVRAERPQVVSVQSLFGLPFDVVDEIRDDGIPVAFTAHDYFALCPTAHLFLPEAQPCRLSEDSLVCHKCCERSPSYNAFWLSNGLDLLAKTCVARPMVQTNLWRLRNAVKQVDGWIPRPRNSKAYSVRRREAIEFLKHVDVLHCISERQAKVFQEICGPLDNIHVLPLMPPTITSLAPVTRLQEEKRSVSFVALNVNGSYKGSKLLENAFRILANTMSGYELHIYGNFVPGPEIKSVFYHGRYQSSDLDQIAAQAGFCIVPSVWDETLCFVGLEMLARGVPLIASARAGVSEFVDEGQNGLVFDPSRDGSLHDAVLKVLQTPETFLRLRSPDSIPCPRIKTFKEHVAQMSTLLEKVVTAVSIPNGSRSLMQTHSGKTNQLQTEID